MPTKLSRRDEAIAMRLREFRVGQAITRTAMARILGINVDRLTSYEFKRAALPCDVAVKLWVEFGLSPKWLFCGDTDEFLAPDLFAPLIHQPWSRGSFSSVYEDRIGPAIEESIVASRDLTRDPEGALAVLRANSRPGMPAAAYHRDLLKKLMRELRAKRSSPRSTVDKRTNVFDFPHVPPPKSDSLLRNLLERAKPLTATAEGQDALAEYLGKRRNEVQRWLSGKIEPGGEITLRLQEWVAAAEASPNKAAAVFRPQRRKTRTSTVDENKTRSGPPRK